MQMDEKHDLNIMSSFYEVSEVRRNCIHVVNTEK
jgi:hypothetical protein